MNQRPLKSDLSRLRSQQLRHLLAIIQLEKCLKCNTQNLIHQENRQ